MVHTEGLQRRFSAYRALMPYRVREILLVASRYDAFVLEEDGSLSEQLWDQYVGLRLSEPPAVHLVTTEERALAVLTEGRFDMVLIMTRFAEGNPFRFAAEVKKLRQDLPVVLLVTDRSELAHLPPRPSDTGVDYVFLWNNDPQTLLAIIKLVEDRLNVEHDTAAAQVRVILLVEDSPAYYSSFLPLIYSVIMSLTRSLIHEGINNLHKQLRMRSRAKILLATSYEEGRAIYEKHRRYILGVISDVRFTRNGRLDAKAGCDFVSEIRQEQPDIPTLLHSAEPETNRLLAQEIGADFIDKNSPSLLEDLRSFLTGAMGFGDFVFRLPDGQEVARASKVHDFMEKLRTVTIESIIWHAERNHISNWLMARTEVTMAEQMRPRRVEEFDDPEQVRGYLIDVIAKALMDKQNDVVADFTTGEALKTTHFMHLGNGSLGGKGRGIAFVRFMVNRTKIGERFPDIDILIPHTLVIGAEEFDAFLDDNNLRRFGLECDDDRELETRFLAGRVRPELVISLRHYLRTVLKPLAVRSSSILEDSHLQPFAGLYATYMIPNDEGSDDARLAQLLDAVRMVWASTFGRDVKAYFAATSHRVEAEKMAVVIQEVIGTRHGDHYYPSFSGVAQSFNFYPFGRLRAAEGIAHVALGLGKTVVEGGRVMRFCPAHPRVLPQASTPRDWLENSQRQFYALRVGALATPVREDTAHGLSLLELAQAEADGELDMLGSVYDANDEVIRDSLSPSGPRLVTFAGVLKYNEFPLGKVLNELLAMFSEGMGCPVEIEFAVNLRQVSKPVFAILQLRPLVSKAERNVVAITAQDEQRAWLRTDYALGNDYIDSIRDIVYMRPARFDRARTRHIVREVEALNARMVAEKSPYLLMGFGRWGSSDPWLGVGVGWSQISGARVMVEVEMEGFHIDPSHGSHFFHNLTSMGIGYLTVPADKPGTTLDWEWLESQPCAEETEHLRLIRLEHAIRIKIDGRRGNAVVLKPSQPE